MHVAYLKLYKYVYIYTEQLLYIASTLIISRSCGPCEKLNEAKIMYYLPKCLELEFSENPSFVKPTLPLFPSLIFKIFQIKIVMLVAMLKPSKAH